MVDISNKSPTEVLALFKKNFDGSWSPLTSVSIGGVSMGAGTAFNEGVSMSGIDLARALNHAASLYPHLVRR